MNTLISKEKWEFIKPVWRIPLAIMIIQVIGGIVGISQNFYGVLMIDYWFGGAVSAVPGFIVGLVWQYTNSPKAIYENQLLVAFFGIICVIITISAFIVPLEKMSSNMHFFN